MRKLRKGSLRKIWVEPSRIEFNAQLPHEPPIGVISVEEGTHIYHALHVSGTGGWELKYDGTSPPPRVWLETSGELLLQESKHGEHTS